ncbi:mechanosensitive ion channel family protein [Hydrogenovibrio sp. 3SP14C1]|uniref:mechanosensitive ion channel family protein n=1 Tax=Hydrogenovibrio sp. 3SP14C1 TaxID=3038774 RepID=UPI002416EE00|nr:mechanosensitive ion channel family protein [Hydrogenovibrio sp. 3SP14C1]MDG4812857.1 mechanosensitive ion channel family protein [Hydrogenovibrio sp. 3SP14C1]
MNSGMFIFQMIQTVFFHFMGLNVAMNDFKLLGVDNDGLTTLFEDFTNNSLGQLVSLFPETWRYLVELFDGQIWFMLLVLILSITFVIDLVFRIAVNFTDYLLDKRKKRFLQTIPSSLSSPVSFYIWLSGAVLALTTIMNQFKLFLELIPYIANFKSTLGVIAVAWFSVRWVHGIELYLKRLERKDKRWDSVTVEAAGKVFRLTVFIITALFVLSALGVNLTGLIAFGGMGGIAVGFAAKDMVSNVLGGLMLYWDKPFIVGDWIRSPEKEIEGTVENIGWRITVVRTFDKRPLYIPNGTFTNITIENPSRMQHRRIKETVGVRYCDVKSVAEITADIRKMLQEHPEIASDETLIVNFNMYNQSTLDILIYAFTKTTVWVKFHEVKEDVLLKVADIVEAHDAEMAFPTRTLYVEDSVRFEQRGSEKLDSDKESDDAEKLDDIEKSDEAEGPKSSEKSGGVEKT